MTVFSCIVVAVVCTALVDDRIVLGGKKGKESYRMVWFFLVA